MLAEGAIITCGQQARELLQQRVQLIKYLPKRRL